MKILLIFYLCACSSLWTNPEETLLSSLKEDTIFVGLGSYCETADILRACKVRKAAFPFDWMLSSDNKTLIKALDEDFSHFLDESFLLPAKSSDQVLLHTYYYMEFHHEGIWRGTLEEIQNTKEQLFVKYQKRIARFRELKEFEGRALFFRFANKYSMEPSVIYRMSDNLEITEKMAFKLYEALKSYFPKLLFSLVIVNPHKGIEIEEEKSFPPHLYMIRANPNLPLSSKQVSYTKFFNQILLER